MITVFFHSEGDVKEANGIDEFRHIPVEKIFWIDLLFPTDGERKNVETVFKVDFEQLKAENKLESNTQYYESEELIFISSNFIAFQDGHFESTPVYFYLLKNMLITERNSTFATFDETIKKMKRNRKGFKYGSDILEGILETKFDLDTDYIEQMAKDIASMSRSLSLRKDIVIEEMLLKISDYQESATLSRDSFVDKQRVTSALLKSNAFKNKNRLSILIKDITAMLDYTSFIFVRLEYLQNTLIGLINIQQNKTIKIFTIVSVVFMPPTLIASIYGMNFKMMPELSWRFGYPLAILLIIGSSAATLLLFKMKKWL